MFSFYVISSVLSYLMANASLVLQLVGSWFSFRKMGLPGWKGIIPYYSMYVLFEKLWETKKFWRVIIYTAVSIFTFIVGYVIVLITAVGNLNMAGSIILLLIGISLLIATVVLLILSLVIQFQLYKRLAGAFGLQNGWAWGLLFVPFVMLPIIGFNKKIQYYGPVNQV